MLHRLTLRSDAGQGYGRSRGYAVTYNGGQPNRNLGEAFLCVWKPKLSTHDPTESERTEAETKMCDGALTASKPIFTFFAVVPLPSSVTRLGVTSRIER